MPRNVQSIIDDLQSGLTELRIHFQNLDSIFGGSAKPTPRGRKSTVRKRGARRTTRRPKGAGPAEPKALKKRSMSSAVRAQRKLQGRYMGLVRNLSAAQKMKVKRVKLAKGYGPALKLAASLRLEK